MVLLSRICVIFRMYTSEMLFSKQILYQTLSPFKYFTESMVRFHVLILYFGSVLIACGKGSLLEVSVSQGKV